MEFQCREMGHSRVFPCLYRKIGCPKSRFYYSLIESHPPVTAVLENMDYIHLDTPDLDINIENIFNEKYFVEVLEKQFIIHVEKRRNIYQGNRITYVAPPVFYFSVCLMGDAQTASGYSYDLNLFDLKYFSLIQADRLYSKMARLPDFLQDYKLAVISKLNTGNLKLSIVLNTFSVSCCIRCDVSDDKIHRSRSGLSCTNCVNAIQNCKYKYRGCPFVDTNTKVKIHRKLFCDYNNVCAICNTTMTSKSLKIHYKKNHSTSLISPNQYWTKITKQTSSTYFIINHKRRFLICEYKICYDLYKPQSEKYLAFKVHSDKRSGELYMYQCELEYWTDNGDTIKRILKLGCCNTQIRKYSDWSTRINLRDTKITAFKIYFTKKYPVL